MLTYSKFFIALLLVFILEGCDHDRSDSPSSKARKASEVVKVPGWEAKGFPLSFAIKAGSMVYVSGMRGMDMKQMKLVEGGVKEETKQILRNLDTVLQAANSSMKQVALCSVSLVNISRDFKDMNEAGSVQAYASFWSKDPPARVAVQVAALAGNASVEIQCNAALNTTNRSIVEVPSLPAPKGFPLSWATKVDGMVYMSGTQGMDMATGKLVPGGVKAETTQALKNIQQLLQAAKSNAGRVVACSVSLIDIKDFAEMNEAYKAFWPEHAELGGLPSRVCVEVSALAGQGKVEVQCTAAGTDVPHGEIPRAVKVPGWPKGDLPFSAATKVDSIAFISGNQGVDMNTSKLVEGGAGPETTQTLKDIKAAVEASGTGLQDVVACEVSLLSMKDFAAVNKAYAFFWPSEPPSRVAVQVRALVTWTCFSWKGTEQSEFANEMIVVFALPPLNLTNLCPQHFRSEQSWQEEGH